MTRPETQLRNVTVGPDQHASTGDPGRRLRARLSATFDRERPFAALMVVPGIVVLALTTTLPLLYLVGTSLFRYDLTAPAGNGFIGFDNYVRLASDERFWDSLRLSAVFTASTVILQVSIGIGLAVLVERMSRGRALVRMAALLPILLAPVVVGLIWRSLMLTPDFGIVNYLSTVLGLGSRNWLGDPSLALGSVVVMHTWQWTPFAYLIFSASLATVPREILEAAEVDGANAWQRFWTIVVPLLRPAIVVVVIFRTVVALSAFDAVYAATGGGPGTATELVDIYIFRVSFQQLSLGYGSALAVAMLVITLAVTLVFLKMRRAAA
ncbi:ABC transporter permease subunit [Phytoactinopolyspora halotolerans]|uniref:ABC transporter permease subunit n=1 Tax=Phytoactinopolyspora halotolerans TaxID=1981512 RepID=A0A6L9SDZ6_9ACTN|nr:ABC transporter permease subunit [Phytoactinopolyspora halotolerans]NEE03337.1 ABC transporter permease subunit [Phytoactinopolyspora halotolerans]